jgi:hypothetical protein
MARKLAGSRRLDADSAVEVVLRELLRSIEPTATQKSGAQRSHNRLRQELDSGQMANRITRSYLSGSYARDTAIWPLDDVDVIFEIDPSYWSAGLFRSYPPPKSVLDTFAAAIRRRYALSSVHGQRRSVRLELYHLDIDVVPAIPTSPSSNIILVPDRTKDDWIESSPRGHSDKASQLNKRHGGKFKPLVKLAKFWNSNLSESVRCKSFTIETIATRIFEVTPFDTLADGLVLFWDFLTSRYDDPTIAKWPHDFGTSFGWFSISVPDAAGTGANTAAYLDDGRARALATKARISRDKLLAAHDARSDATLEQHILSALRA